MANSKYEYVKQFEQQQILLPSTYIVVRVDGKGFHKFTKFYNFKKPNDIDGISNMNYAAKVVMDTFPDIILGYGQSDEYSFLLSKDSTLYNRRSDKISSCVGSTFTSAYVFNFEKQLKKPLVMPYLPVFDSRCVLYPDIQNVKDYFAWRQVDCHINNLYNTCFWGLALDGLDKEGKLRQGMPKQEVEQILSKTNAGQKNELLFSQLGINYNNEPEVFKKGSVLFRIPNQQEGEIIQQVPIGLQGEEQKLSRKQRKKLKGVQVIQQDDKPQQIVCVKHIDIVKEDFWLNNQITQ
ncbi:hypothetical protein pb186bvf_010029 [Paramecium bursaria]